MRYAIIEIQKAESIGISSANHFRDATKMVVNEKEIMYSDAIGDTFEEKISLLEGKIYNKIAIKKQIKNGYKL